MEIGLLIIGAGKLARRERRSTALHCDRVGFRPVAVLVRGASILRGRPVATALHAETI